jgi:hypothetical protein
MLTAAIEIHLGIICCSVPSLKKFATQVLGMGGNTNTSRSGSIPMHRQKTSVVYPTSESTEEFRPDFTPLEHKYASPHNNRVTIKAVNRDTLDCDEELQVPPPGHIAVKMEYTQITSVVAGEGSVV